MELHILGLGLRLQLLLELFNVYSQCFGRPGSQQQLIFRLFFLFSKWMCPSSQFFILIFCITVFKADILSNLLVMLYIVKVIIYTIVVFKLTVTFHIIYRLCKLRFLAFSLSGHLSLVMQSYPVIQTCVFIFCRPPHIINYWRQGHYLLLLA